MLLNYSKLQPGYEIYFVSECVRACAVCVWCVCDVWCVCGVCVMCVCDVWCVCVSVCGVCGVCGV